MSDADSVNVSVVTRRLLAGIKLHEEEEEHGRGLHNDASPASMKRRQSTSPSDRICCNKTA